MCQQKWSFEFCSITNFTRFAVVEEANVEISAAEDDYCGWCGKMTILPFSLFFWNIENLGIWRKTNCLHLLFAQPNARFSCFYSYSGAPVCCKHLPTLETICAQCWYQRKVMTWLNKVTLSGEKLLRYLWTVAWGRTVFSYFLHCKLPLPRLSQFSRGSRLCSVRCWGRLQPSEWGIGVLSSHIPPILGHGILP